MSLTGNPQWDEALARDFTIDITTIGARSGLPRRIEIWYLHVEDRIFITGTPGPRDWVANLAADPSLVFHLKESLAADLTARALPVSDPLLRRRVFQHPSAQWYLTQTSLDDLVANAPMIEVEFVTTAS